MSLQETTISKVKGDSGEKKKIHEASEEMILDILQITQYSKPVESTVRELASNASDSQKEKAIALQILEEGKDPSEFYIVRTEGEFADSNWDPSYYDPKYLDKEHNTVELIYTEGRNPTGFSDKFTVIDHGVGLGMPRLEGYFSMGFSTKRNTVNQLGGFGLGAKAPLSLRCDFYTVTTIHNGKKFKFNVYSHKFESCIGKFNMETEQENPFITFESGYKVYYEETEEKNMTQIDVPTKRHMRDQFKQAIRKQLLYIKNLTFTIVDENYIKTPQEVEVEVIYNSENLLISEQTIYNKPHIVVVKGDNKDSEEGICYGFVDFTELEMENLKGKVGFKCPIRAVVDGKVVQEGVEVTPSREAVVWSDATKAYIQKAIQNAKDDALRVVQKELRGVTTYYEWLDKLQKLSFRSNRYVSSYDSRAQKALSVLANLVDLDVADMTYKGFPYFRTTVLAMGVEVHHINKGTSSDPGAIKRKPEAVIPAERLVNPDKVTYLKDIETFNTARDLQIINSIGAGFVTVGVAKRSTIKAALKELSQERKDQLGAYFNIVQNDAISHDDYLDRITAKVHAMGNKWVEDRLRDAENGDTTYPIYSEVTVTKESEEEVQKIEEESHIQSLSPAERRRLQEKILVHTLYHDKAVRWRNSTTNMFTKTRHETSFTDLITLLEAKPELKIYYGNQDDYTLLTTAALVCDMHVHNPTYPKSGISEYITQDNALILFVNTSVKKKFDELEIKDDHGNIVRYGHPRLLPICNFYAEPTSTGKFIMHTALTRKLVGELLQHSEQDFSYINILPSNSPVHDAWANIENARLDSFAHTYGSNPSQDELEEVLKYVRTVVKLQRLRYLNQIQDSEVEKQLIEEFGMFVNYDDVMETPLEQYDLIKEFDANFGYDYIRPLGKYIHNYDPELSLIFSTLANATGNSHYL